MNAEPKTLDETNPVEDLGRVLFRPLSFSARLATDASLTSNWAVGKAIGFYLFATLLLSIAGLAPRANLIADFLDTFSESMRPLYEQLGVNSADVAYFESVVFFLARLVSEMGVFVGVVQAFCALLLFSAILALAWPRWEFRRILAWVAYSHWFVILGLLVHSGFLLGALATLYLARVSLEADGRAGWWNLLNRWGLIGLLGILVSIVGLSLI
jgi:hypothetical protein